MRAASRRPLWFSQRKRRCSDGLATGAKVDVDSSLEVLTERERDIVGLVAQGMTNDDIGRSCGRSQLVESIGNGVQIVAKQAGVHVQCHGGTHEGLACQEGVRE